MAKQEKFLSRYILNDAETFSSSLSSGASYVGNVITHELGHVLGLSHSQVNHSTMFFHVERTKYLKWLYKAGIRSLWFLIFLGEFLEELLAGETHPSVFLGLMFPQFQMKLASRRSDSFWSQWIFPYWGA